MKILLIVPNIKSYDFMPCLSVAALKGYVNKMTKHNAEIIDLAFHKKDWKKHLIKQVRMKKPDIIGFSILSFNYPEALKISRLIKKNFNIKIIFGGVHVILSPQEVIENEVVDIICTGEGEEVLKDLLDKSLNCKNIKGIWYKQDGGIIKNKNRKLIENLDKLPFPDFDDFNLEKYFIINHDHLPIMASRGCPYNCAYCSNHALRKKLDGKYVRFRSVDNVMEEIELRIKQYSKKGLKYLYIFDDTFILYKDFVYEFCKKFNEKGFNKYIKWTANVRANLVTDEIIQTMKDAGCYEVRMGVESGNDYTRNTVYKRNMAREQIDKAFKIIKRHGLQLRLDFIFGAPCETLDMMEESFEMAKQSDGDNIFFSPLYPFPGTDIKKVCEKEQVVEENIHYATEGFHPVNKTKFISRNQIQNFSQKIKMWQTQRYINEGFHLRGFMFIFDILAFLFYYKYKYDFEFNQIYRWNVQRYKLNKL